MSRNESTDGSEGSLLADDWLADLREIPSVPGIAAGGIAWLVGYLLTVVVFYVGPATVSVDSTVERLKGIGLIFYNAQFVNAIETLSAGDMQETIRLNFILEQSGTAVPAPVYFAIPIVALLVAGALIGYRFLGDDVEPVTFPLLGVVLAVGYLPLATAGAFLMELPVKWSLGIILLEPDLLEAVAFGFVYPFLLGTIGTAVGYTLQQ